MSILLRILLLILSANSLAAESVCYGTTSNGRLVDGVQLPSNGQNFVGYSMAGELLGRTYVHSKVREIVLAAYKDLELELKGKVYKYAESGFKTGGQFKPHKTHRNGLSVDFMVPVLNAAGKSVYFPTNAFNGFGYEIEFNNKGIYKEYTIDYEALAAHIVALHKEAKARGYDLWRVIFAPGLQANLFTTKYGSYLKKNVKFSKKRSWVRHDEHYHVDFSIPCG